MKVINLGESNSVLNHFMAQLRDKDIQKDMLQESGAGRGNIRL